jgi:hypothetical protein
MRESFSQRVALGTYKSTKAFDIECRKSGEETQRSQMGQELKLVSYYFENFG